MWNVGPCNGAESGPNGSTWSLVEVSRWAAPSSWDRKSWSHTGKIVPFCRFGSATGVRYQDIPDSLRHERSPKEKCYAGHYYFVCEAMTNQRVGIEPLEDKLLDLYQHMYVREIDLRRRTRPLVCSVPQE